MGSKRADRLFSKPPVPLHAVVVNRPALARKAESAPLSPVTFYATALGLVCLAYFLVFWVTETESFGHAVLSAMRNVASLAIVAAAVQPVLTRVLHRKLWSQLLLHLPLASLFSLLWYWLLLVLIGVSEGTPTAFAVERFLPTSGVRWQLLQGVTVYALLAAICQIRRRPPHVLLSMSDFERTTLASQAQESGRSRYFIRNGDDIQPVTISEIISVTGADDYAEVSTCGGGRHLTRQTLAEFQQELDSDRFVRVHRSRIVNIDRIERAEPAGGGRLLLHMQNGETIQTSRTGARLLREHIL